MLVVNKGIHSGTGREERSKIKVKYFLYLLLLTFFLPRGKKC